MSLVALVFALSMAAQESSPPAENPVSAFLHAADINDTAAMEAVLHRKSAGFLKQIKGCYLRRVYSDAVFGRLLAAWMCDLGPDRSRVVIANIGLLSDGRVSVIVERDTTNKRPAPERTGSAFAK